MNLTARVSTILFVTSTLLSAQAPQTQPAKPPASVTVTGCLQRTQTSSYTLTSSDGKRYELRAVNADIKLADHVDQSVTVTGASAQTAPNVPPPATKVDPQGFLDVIALVVLSPSCKP